MRSTAAFAIITAAALAAAPAMAQADCTRPLPLSFNKGASTAIRTGGILRAEDVCYFLSARAGQRLTLVVRSPDSNVVVAVYEPGYRVTPANDGPDIAGKTLRGAADQDEAQAVKALLPATGRYLFVLGTTRGAGGQYRMQVSIH